jgi:hypothetical protein
VHPDSDHLGGEVIRRVVVEGYVVEGADANAVMTGVTYGLYATLDEIRDETRLRRFFDYTLGLQSQLGASPRTRP